MHLYERAEQGMDMWHRDESKYNTKKFNADVDLLDLDFSEELMAAGVENPEDPLDPQGNKLDTPHNEGSHTEQINAADYGSLL